MSSPFAEAAGLGVIQGLTEFLPVSSDGHLGVATVVFGLESGSLALNVMLHAGTLAATILLMRERTFEAVGQGLRALVKPRRFVDEAGGRDALFVLLATLPTGIIGLLLRHQVEQWTTSPMALGLGFLLTTAALVSTYFVHPGQAEVPRPSLALLLGVVQGLAVLPGVSRSGLTIALALWLGVKPSRAFELSMLMSLPAVFGALLLEVPQLAGSANGLGPGLLGAGIAFGVGVVALALLRNAVVRGHFPFFAVWTLPLAGWMLARAFA
jgi:undecaprenyl-diphosphatase